MKSEIDLVKSLSEVFENVDVDRLTSDTDFFKDCINSITSTIGQKWDKYLALLVILHHYENIVDMNTISLQMKGLICSIAFEILSLLDFAKFYRSKEIYGIFNKFLSSNFGKCNEFQAQRLYESFLRFKNSKSDKTLFFFQAFTVNQLFRNQQYSNIAYLIETFEIDDIESILPADSKYLNNNSYTYFHSLGYALIMEGSLEQAYKLITTTLLLTVETIDLPIFHLMLTEIAYLTLRLNLPYENMSIIIIKYRVKLLPRVLDILQNYYIYDYESFLCNYTLMVMHFKNKRQNLMLSLFTEEFLTNCIHNILQSKANNLLRISDSTSVEQIENEYNKRINEINEKYIGYPIKIKPFKIHKTQISPNQTTQLSDQYELISVSKKLQSILNIDT